MIQELATFTLSSPLKKDQSYTFNLDQVSPDFHHFNFCALQQVTFPNVLPQIQQSFIITIDGVDIAFKIGNISFQQLLKKIQSNLGVTFTVQEYLSPEFQSSGRILIRKNLLPPPYFNITIPSNQIDFFGNLTWDADEKAYVSQYQCNLLQQQFVIIRSNAVCSKYFQYDHMYDVLASIQLDSTSQSQYLTQQFDIVQNKVEFSKFRTINVYFTDQNGNKLSFPTNSVFYLKLSCFHFRYMFIDVMLDNMRDMLKLYIYKNYKKTVDIETDQQEDKQPSDIIQQVTQ